jgi:hypothetical protein
MPFPLLALAAGSSLLGAASSLIGGNKAAKAQKKAADAQIAESRRQYDQTRADYAPWRAAGESALARITADMTDPMHRAFTTSPGYDFRLSEGVKAAERSASARGLLKSGAAMKGIQRYGEGLAAAEYGDWWNRNAGLAGVGQQATGSTTQAGQFATSNINNAYQQQGNARASSYANTSSAVNSGINNVLSAYLFSRTPGFA